MAEKRRINWRMLVLSLLLLIQLGGLATICAQLYMEKSVHALDAQADGRRAIIDLATGDISGNILQTEPPAMSREEYERQRIAELTGEAPPPIDTSDDTVESDTSVTPKPPVGIPTRIPNKPLADAPLAALQETMPDGTTLPRINESGLRPWEYYSKPYELPVGKRPLSIVITNVGLHQRIIPQITALDERITLAFSPYSSNLTNAVKRARLNGFESWMMLPMQHIHYPIHDYGTMTLLDEASASVNRSLLHSMMAKTAGIVGFVGTPQEQFSHSSQMPTLYKELRQRGLLLTLHDKFYEEPRENSPIISYARPHIDSSTLPASLDTLWRDIEAYTASNGSAVITLSPMPKVLDALNDWIATLDKQNIALVPLSAHISYKE